MTSNTAVSSDQFKSLLALQADIAKKIKPQTKKINKTLTTLQAVLADKVTLIFDNASLKTSALGALTAIETDLKGRTFSSKANKRAEAAIQAKIDNLRVHIKTGKKPEGTAPAKTPTKSKAQAKKEAAKEAAKKVEIKLSLTENGRVAKELQETQELKTKTESITKENAKELCLTYHFKMAYVELLNENDIDISAGDYTAFSEALSESKKALAASDHSKALINTVVPHGIKNGGYHCCFIAATQLLKWSLGEDLLEYMPNFFAHFTSQYNDVAEGRKIRACVNEFCSSEGSSTFSHQGQEDASEILVHILDAMVEADVEARDEKVTKLVIKPKATPSLSPEQKASAAALKRAESLLEKLSGKTESKELYKLSKAERNALCREDSQDVFKKGILKTTDGKKIHANTMTLRKDGPSYVAAQAPLENEDSIRNFWNVAMNANHQCIVDLTNSADKLAPYYPKVKESATYGDTTITCDSEAKLSETSFLYEYSCKGADGKQVKVTRIHYTDCAKASPLDPKAMCDLSDQIKQYSGGKTPIFHDVNGTGRVGTVITSLEMIAQKDTIKDNTQDKISAIIQEGRSTRGQKFVENALQMHGILNLAKFLVDGTTPKPLAKPSETSNATKRSAFSAALHWIFQGVTDLLMNIISFIDNKIVRIDNLHSNDPENIQASMLRSHQAQASKPKERVVIKTQVAIPEKAADRASKAEIMKMLGERFGTFKSSLRFDTSGLPVAAQKIDDVGGQDNKSVKNESQNITQLSLPPIDGESYDFDALLKSFSFVENVDDLPLNLGDGKGPYLVPQTKQLQIDKAPESLILNPKRFAFTGDGSEKISKPITGIKETFTVPKDIFADDTAADYELTGITMHLGSSPGGGHYTSYVKIKSEDSFQWYYCDDGSTTPVTKERALEAAETAYVLVGNKIK